MVDIHADELVGEIDAHVAGVLEGVLHGFGAVVQAVADAGFEDAGDVAASLFREAFVDDIAAEGQGKAVVLLAPPDAEVFAKLKPFVAVGELAFVDDEADIGFAFFDSGKDLVEGDDNVVEGVAGAAEPELEGEEGAGHCAGDGDAFGGDLVASEFLLGDKHGTVAIAHAGAAGEQGVLIADVGVGVDADGRNIEFAAGGAFIEGLNVLEDVFEAVAFGVDEFLGEAVEHEGVVRVGRVAEG